MKRRSWHIWPSAVCLIIASAAPAQTIENSNDVAARLARHVQTLASDAFEGRMPGTAGENRTVDYLIDAFRTAGLQPGGELVAGKRGWYQRVPLLNVAVDGPVAVSIDGAGAIAQGKEVVLQGTAAAGSAVDLRNTPIVFVGYGIDSPQYKWDDYKGADLTGKVAVYLFGDPIAADGTRRFGGKTMSAAGAPGRKVEAAVRRGAAAVLMIHEPAVLGYQWTTTVNAGLQTRQDIVRDDVAQRNAPIQGTLRNDVALALLARTGMDFAALKARASAPDFKPITLPGVTFSARFAIKRSTIVSRNVIARLPGSTHADETVLIGAHWDHQGTGAPDARGDRVYNGAIDNATGVATMLEVARTLARRGRPQRSIVFAAWTLEEPGILGSEYYAVHPLYPLAKTAATVNFDAMFPLGRARDFSNNAPVETEANDLLAAAGQRQGRRLIADAHPDLFLRLRSDHAPLARRGVPAIFYMAGEDLVDGGKARADATIGDYFAHRYHRQSDDYDPAMRFDGIAQDVALVDDFAWRLATSRQWPEWKPGGEFKTVRDATAAMRR